jgi:hypothetical protein
MASPSTPTRTDDEDEDGPDLLRVRMTAEAARSFVERAVRIVAPGGRRARCAASRSIRRAPLPRAATATTSTDQPAMLDPQTALRVLRDGQIEIVGRIVGSSNNAMLATVTVPCPDPERPIRPRGLQADPGERPLDDFPDGTLSRREVAAWHVSEALGWGIVPPSVLRDGPFGEGMVQQYVELD